MLLHRTTQPQPLMCLWWCDSRVINCYSQWLNSGCCLPPYQPVCLLTPARSCRRQPLESPQHSSTLAARRQRVCGCSHHRLPPAAPLSACQNCQVLSPVTQLGSSPVGDGGHARRHECKCEQLQGGRDGVEADEQGGERAYSPRLQRAPGMEICSLCRVQSQASCSRVLVSGACDVQERMPGCMCAIKCGAEANSCAACPQHSISTHVGVVERCQYGAHKVQQDVYAVVAAQEDGDAHEQAGILNGKAADGAPDQARQTTQGQNVAGVPSHEPS